MVTFYVGVTFNVVDNMGTRRLKLKEGVINGWKLIPYVFTDESDTVIGYNFQCIKPAKGGFIEFIRLDLHKKGRPEEDAPHLHVRVESREIASLDEARSIIDEAISMILPEIRGIVK